jgi:hypothetical protein
MTLITSDGQRLSTSLAALAHEGQGWRTDLSGQPGSVVELRFDPAEKRDSHGRWTSGAAPAIEKITEPIGREGARGNSRAVSHDEFQRIAAEGRDRLHAIQGAQWSTRGLDQGWEDIKNRTYAEVQKSWGGATIDPRTGRELPQGADKYAMSVKPAGLDTTSVPEHASREQFSQAMDIARGKYGRQLAKGGSYLGIFHDDDLNRIDIDPVTVLDSLDDVESVGAYTHAIGGAYHFKSGDGFWPPHVEEGVQMSNETTHWAGPGQWRSYADSVQHGFDDSEDEDTGSEEGGLLGQLDMAGDASSIIGQLLDLAHTEAWRREARGPGGQWTSSSGSTARRSWADGPRGNPNLQAGMARHAQHQAMQNRQAAQNSVAERIAEEKARKALEEARAEVSRATRELKETAKTEETQKHRTKLAVHALLVVGGALLAAVLAHFDVSPVLAAMSTAFPLLAAELTDWKKKLLWT